MLGAVTAIPTPEEWLAKFNATIEEVKAKTEAFQQDLEQAGATERSPDGSLSVTVAPNGSLTNLQIDESAWKGSGAELAGKIMQLARKAQRAAAVNVAEAFAPLGSPDSEALHMITGYIPEPEEDEEEPEDSGYSFVEETTVQPEQTPPPASQAEPPRRPSRPQRGGADDDDEFTNDDLFGR
jgi:DNA-binding protein YbaB